MADFIYCLNSSTIRPTPLLEKIQVARAAGYAAIELWHDDMDLYLSQGGTLADLRKALDDAGLAVPTTIMLKGWWDTTGDDHTRAMDEVRRRLHQAAAIGAVYSIAGPPHGPVDDNIGARRYAELLNLGREFGVRPAMEYLGFVQDVKTIDDALRVMDGSGQIDATIVLDPFHCFRGGGGMEAIARLDESRIAISHFNDAPAHPPADQQHDPDRVLPGDGHLDLRRYLDLLRGTGYRRWLSLELFRRDLWERDPLEVARIGLEKMRSAAEE